jgi:cyclase
MEDKMTIPTFEHFELTRLADGVYAAIELQGGAAYSNAGIIDLGDQTLIFDTFDAPEAAQDLKTAAEHLTGRPAACIVNSHWHGDHWSGNQVFAGAAIIATHKTLEEMRPLAKQIEAMRHDPSDLENTIRQNQERLESETDERWRAYLESSTIRLRYTLDTLSTLAVCLPNVTFDTRLVFHGTRRTAELLTWGVGHTCSDCFLVLPEEHIAFAGDLGFFQCQPFMPSGEPPAWVAQLEKMEQSDIETFIPGHGPVGTKADIALQRQYIILLEETVVQAIKARQSIQEFIRQPLPAPFDAWLSRGIARFEANAKFLYQRLSDQ